MRANLFVAAEFSVLWEHPSQFEFLVVLVSEAFGVSTGRGLLWGSSVADELASVHLLEFSDLGAVPFALSWLGDGVDVVDEPVGVAWIIDGFAEAEGTEIGLDQLGSGVGFFELDVDVDSSVSGVEGFWNSTRQTWLPSSSLSIWTTSSPGPATLMK